MRFSSVLILAAAFLCAAVTSLVAAGFAVRGVEASSETGVRRALDGAGLDWAEVQADGLQLHLTGTAPTEADRFRARSVAGRVIDQARVIDSMAVTEAEAIAPPRFSVEILRNDDDLSLYGLFPAGTDRQAFLRGLSRLDGVDEVSDLLESAEHEVPEGWQAALDYAREALDLLPRAKISVSAGQVAITAMADSPEARTELEEDLRAALPEAVTLDLAISAPRPVITPFTLRFVIDGDGPRFDACSADTEEARDAILAAAEAAGAPAGAACTIGLGVPTPDWAPAAVTAIEALAEMGPGTVTFSDADVTLVAAQGTDPSAFDDAVGGLKGDLPDLFALHAVLPDPPDTTDKGPAEFSATLTPDGRVELRGRVASELTRTATESFAEARFGADRVDNAARVDEDLPTDWPMRVLAGLEALSRLANGSVVVREDSLAVEGATGAKDANAEIARLLPERLGESQDFTIDVVYREALDPLASIPTPEECIDELAGVQSVQKINFEPGSAKVDAASVGALDDIAEILKVCGKIPLEIQGHTDSQGRESMNQSLSQQRAQAVLDQLRQRRVLISSFTARGYGEAQPIADNKTEEGRESNRRIEFTLRPDETEAGAEAEADAGAGDPDAPAAAAEAATESGTEAGDTAPAGETNLESGGRSGQEDAGSETGRDASDDE